MVLTRRRAMGARRTVYHFFFTAYVRERCPPGFAVVPEVVLTKEPQRADLLVLRRRRAQPDAGRSLRRLWPLLSRETLLEYKSPGRPPRAGDWVKLLGYAAQWHASRVASIGRARNLSLVLAAPALTRTLVTEAKRMGWRLEALGKGYHRVHGAIYPSFLVLLDEVAADERDDLLAFLARAKMERAPRETIAWLRRHTMGAMDIETPEELEEFKQFIRRYLARLPPEERFETMGLPMDEYLAGLAPEERVAGLAPEERVAGLAPEERVAGLAPEERVAGLAPEETVLALSDELLRRLPESFIASLPEQVREQIRRRLAH